MFVHNVYSEERGVWLRFNIFISHIFPFSRGENLSLMFSYSAKKFIQPLLTNYSTKHTCIQTIRFMSTQREQEIVENLTQVRLEVEKFKGNNTVRSKVDEIDAHGLY